MKKAATGTPQGRAPQHVLPNHDKAVCPINSLTRLVPQVVLAGIVLSMIGSAVILSGCSDRTILSMETKEEHMRKIAPKFAQVRVWFVRDHNGTMNLIPVVRTVATRTMVHDAIQQLLQGPTDEEIATGLSSEIPKGTVLINVDEGGENVELNLSQRFSNGAGESLETRMEQLRRTITDSVNNRKVFLDVEGKRLTEASGEGLEVKQPINM